jgi:hypothetical protein
MEYTKEYWYLFFFKGLVEFLSGLVLFWAFWETRVFISASFLSVKSVSVFHTLLILKDHACLVIHAFL